MIAKALSAIAPLLGWVFIGGLVLALLMVLYLLLREFVQARWPDVFKRKTPDAEAGAAGGRKRRWRGRCSTRPTSWPPPAATARPCG